MIHEITRVHASCDGVTWACNCGTQGYAHSLPTARLHAAEHALPPMDGPIEARANGAWAVDQTRWVWWEVTRRGLNWRRS